MKKTISLLLSLVMLFSIMAGLDYSAFAASGNLGSLVWIYNSANGSFKISGTGEMTLNSYTEDDVTYYESIPWSGYRSNIKSIEISEGITSICRNAFLYCRNAKSVNIPTTVTKIDEGAFESCSGLESVSLPSALKEIGQGAFCGCSSLKTITIPKNVIKIGNDAFSGCENLETVNWNAVKAGLITSADSSYLFYDSGKNTQNGLTINFSDSCDSVVSGTNLFNYSKNYVTIINIGKNMGGTLSVGSVLNETTINMNSNNKEMHLKKVDPIKIDNITSKSALRCTLNIGKNVTYLNTGWNDFSVNLDSSQITEVANYACYKYSRDFMEELIKNGLKSVKTVGDYAFYQSHLTAFPENVEYIGKEAFYDCQFWINKRIINLSSNIKHIGYNAFYLSDVKRVNYDGTLEQWNNLVSGTVTGLENKMIVCNDGVINCNHSDEIITVVDPTCTKSGYTSKRCAICGYDDYEKYDYVSPTGHKYITSTTKATTGKNGNTITKCSVCGSVSNSTTIYFPKTISLATTLYTYDGKVKIPSVTVKDSKGKTLVKNTDYTVSYASGRKNVGKYAVKITFKGNYSGTKTLYFTIKPKATSISSVSAGSKKFTVKWKKQSTQVTGYQIQYSTSSKFSSPKYVTVSNYKTTSKTISKLKGKKKYYVRVRTYKTVSGTKYYSSWSSAKSVTTKK